MRISGEARDNCTHNEQLYISYFLLNIINIIELRMMAWMGHMSYRGDRKNIQKTSHST
jgi:hypothetical protein